MNIFSYIKANKTVVGLIIIIILSVNFVLLLNPDSGKFTGDIIYINVLIAVFTLIFSISTYIGWRGKYKSLRDVLNLKENTDGSVPQDNSFYSLMIRDLINNKNDKAELQVRELKESIDELNDYITKWVHEIKIPVSVSELVLERAGDTATTNEIRTEIERIKFLVNQVLHISRATNYSEDLAVGSVELDRTVKSAVKRNSTLLISKNIEINVSNLDYAVLSDEKWLSYTLDQLLNNSYKYVNHGGLIDINASSDENGNVKLVFRDNGVGILPKDITRVFDKSFTGNNGANISKSTGMGLYITKKMLDKLGHRIEVTSQPGVYTEFTITFYRISDYTSLPD